MAPRCRRVPGLAQVGEELLLLPQLPLLLLLLRLEPVQPRRLVCPGVLAPLLAQQLVKLAVGRLIGSPGLPDAPLY
eukprot:CAMPEP_0174943200 /NCGR_PEP_ID=MMETSP1355-20121228/76036_1 /TAXON_ID=464990 /ORGANISM="Hemiselmis tepida, Strain CCMP443" /LENGTH=75 /DNA_ID=CAMNT_0016190423 /DNA_START=14 /DNA_END=238 /DNA_ORIENTATION=+